MPAFGVARREPGVTVTLVGIAFSREARNVVGFEVTEA
jgi:hypothetical protein